MAGQHAISAAVQLNGNTSITMSSASDVLTLGGIVGGSGGLTMLGNGLLTLTNANTYLGGTTISGGTLQLGDGTSGHDGALLNTSGVTNDAVMVYNLSGIQTVGYPISGNGRLIKAGSGTLTLSNGDSTGPNGNGGILIMASGINSNIAVNPGAILQYASGGNLNNGCTITVNGGTLDLQDQSDYIGGLTMSNRAEVIATANTGVSYSLWPCPAT